VPSGQELAITLSLHGLEHTLCRTFPPTALPAIQDFVNSFSPASQPVVNQK
jgi:hypothetical protein